VDGEKAHPTQKPEALLYRVILASTNPGDLILDPFFGTGTTGAVAKLLHRSWIGIEREAKYIQLAQQRIDAVEPESFDETTFDVRDRKRLAPRVAFSLLLEAGLLLPGQQLYFQSDGKITATVKPDGRLLHNGMEGSIHQVARQILDGRSCNGWDLWHYQDEDGLLQPIDRLREIIRGDGQA
jgi:modification methylase